MNTISTLKWQFLDFVLCKDEQIFASNLSEDDWKSIVKWCVDHRLTYVFVKHLKQSSLSPSLTSNQHIQYLENRARKAPVRQLKIQANLLHLDSILAANGIDYLILKGPVLAFKYYRDSAIRRMRDIDIIVKPERFGEACNLLLQQGYKMQSKAQKIDFDARLKIAQDAPPLIHNDFNIAIEVHHRTSSPRLKHSEFELSVLADFWDHADSVKIGNKSLPCENAEILLAHIILHGVRSHAFNNGPALILDLYFLIKNGSINWKKFDSYCTYLNLGNEVNLAFSLLEHYYPDLEIEGNFERCQDDRLIQACQILMLSDPGQKQYERLVSSLKSGTFLEAFFHCKNILFPKRERITAVLGFSTHPYLARLPVWWAYIFRSLYNQYLSHNSDLQSSEDLTLVFRWLNR